MRIGEVIRTVPNRRTVRECEGLGARLLVSLVAQAVWGRWTHACHVHAMQIRQHFANSERAIK